MLWLTAKTGGAHDTQQIVEDVNAKAIFDALYYTLVEVEAEKLMEKLLKQRPKKYSMLWLIR